MSHRCLLGKKLGLWGSAPMGTPPGGTSQAARESLIRDGDGSRVWVPLSRAFPADPCCSPGRGGFPPGGTSQAITLFPCRWHTAGTPSAKRQVPPLHLWESPGAGRVVSYRDRKHLSNIISTLSHHIPIPWPCQPQDLLSLTKKD